jgi:hypothetical protein
MRTTTSSGARFSALPDLEYISSSPVRATACTALDGVATKQCLKVALSRSTGHGRTEGSDATSSQITTATSGIQPRFAIPSATAASLNGYSAPHFLILKPRPQILQENNRHPRPFIWTATTSRIIKKHNHCKEVLHAPHYLHLAMADGPDRNYLTGDRFQAPKVGNPTPCPRRGIVTLIKTPWALTIKVFAVSLNKTPFLVPQTSIGIVMSIRSLRRNSKVRRWRTARTPSWR